MKAKQFLLIAITALVMIPMGAQADEYKPDSVFPPGAMQVAAPGSSAPELIEEARELGGDITTLRKKAMHDTSMKAFGSALQRYESVRNALVKQLALLEEAIDIADDTRVRIQAIREYDRVEKEVVAAKRFLAILDIQ